MGKGAVGSNKIIRMTARTVITSGLIFIIALYAIAIFMNHQSQFPYISLESENALYTITRTDGSTETYYQNHFPLVHYNETLTCEIAPLEDVGEIENGTLVFSLYHCYVSVYCGEDLIYQQTDPEEGKMIGHRYYVIPLPDGYENETITIVAVCSEHDTISSFIDPKIIPASCTTYAFRDGSFATGILLITLLIASLFIEVYCLVVWILEKRNDGLFSISFLCTCVCLWYMGFSGCFQPFVESTTFLADAEYVGMYLMPVALSFFIQRHTDRRKVEMFCVAETLLLLGFFVIATVMTLLVPGVSYVDYIEFLRILFLITLILLLIEGYRERGRERGTGETVLFYGMTITISLGVIELVRFLIAEQISSIVPWISNSIMPLCIIALVVTAFMYDGVHVTENQYHRIEAENLKKLAYVDQLTGAPNRTACYEKLDQMRKNNVQEYVVVFIDINFLKKTNDTWGHDKGDELIRTASDLLQKYFTGEDFFGRWGGDEFVAVHLGTLDETKKIMAAIQKEMDELNASGKHDFNLSESWGFGVSTKEDPIDPDAAIRYADDQMYMAKLKVHAARTS